MNLIDEHDKRNAQFESDLIDVGFKEDEITDIEKICLKNGMLFVCTDLVAQMHANCRQCVTNRN